MPRPPPTGSRGPLVAALVALSLFLHALALPALLEHVRSWRLARYEAPIRITLLAGDPLPGEARPLSDRADAVVKVEPEPEPEPIEEPDTRMPDGQVVDVPPPAEDKTPLQADYLAEHDNAVPEQTRTAQFKINPEILADRFSRESRMELDDALDVAASSASTGATAGGVDAPDGGKGAPRSMIPSQYAFTNKEGLAAPVSASSSRQQIAGSPSNDLLDEKLGDSVALNTREFLGAGYLNRIKRQVSFYWDQCLSNLPYSIRWTKPRYVTVVAFVLTADGALESIDVMRESGIGAADDCVTGAFRIAGPFPNPPAQLVRRDGRIYLDGAEFTVQVGQASMAYQGVDPRAGVQFPGILNAPR